MTKLNQQFQDTLKPATELLNTNLNTMEALVKQQQSLISAIVTDSVAVTKNVVAQQELAGALQLQQEYVKGLGEKISESGKEVYALLNEAGQVNSEKLKAAVTPAK